MPITPRLTAAALLAALVISACSSPSSTVAPSTPAAPSPSPTPEGLSHPTGSAEIVLRFDEGGGFVPMEFFAAHVPAFTLYGDGRVVFVSRDTGAGPSADGVTVGAPVRTAVLTEAQVQALLVFALRDGGLAAARTDYQNPNVADAPTAVFEIHADGDSKTVSVVALGLEGQPGPDTAIKAAFLKLADRLRDFDLGGTLATAAYVPAAYRGVLMDAAGAQGVRIRDWPWPAITAADFSLPQDQNAFQSRTRTLTPDDVAVLAVTGSEGGIVGGVFLRAADGAVYSLVVRPLLPDEKA